MRILDTPSNIQLQSQHTATFHNDRLKDHRILREWAIFLRGRFDCFQAAEGNPFELDSSILSEDISKALLRLYRSPPKTLKHLIELKGRNGLGSCAVCGSLHNTQIDHYLPKDVFPEYAVLSKNLIPACNCNQAKWKNYKGTSTDERFINPHYDQFSHRRLLYVRFSNARREYGTWIAPSAKVELHIAKGTREHRIAEFHLRELLDRTKLSEWQAEQFRMLCQGGRRYLPGARSSMTSGQIKKEILTELRKADYQHGGSNNWRSIFFFSISRGRNFDFIWKNRASIFG